MAFSAPAFITSILHGPINGILPGIYAKDFGLSLGVIGTILMISRLFDAATDPLIGYLSDHTRSRFGRRKPWMFLGSCLLLFGAYKLFVPPENVGVVYFTVWFMLFYLFMTMMDIPYSAWQVELSRDYHQRTRIITYRQIFMIVGSIAFGAIPLLPFLPTSEFTPQVMKYVAWIIIIILPPLTILPLWLVAEPKDISTKESTSLKELYSSVIHNKPFVHLATCFLLNGLAGGLFGSIGFLFFDTYLLIGGSYTYIMISTSVIILVAMPFWLNMMKRFNKHKVWAVGSFIGALFFPAIFFIEPGPNAFILMLVIYTGAMAFYASGMVGPMSMLGDVIDYDTLKSGISRSAQYYSFWQLVMKTNAAIGGGVGFLILGLFKYDATAKVHTATEIIGIKLTAGAIPMILFLIVAILAWFFPIDRHRQAIIKKRIESLSERASILNK